LQSSKAITVFDNGKICMPVNKKEAMKNALLRVPATGTFYTTTLQVISYSNDVMAFNPGAASPLKRQKRQAKKRSINVLNK
jgi:hypothetical protein